MEKHMIRYIAILVLGIIVVAIPLVYFFPESAAEPVVRTSCPHDGTFLFSMLPGVRSDRTIDAFLIE